MTDMLGARASVGLPLAAVVILTGAARITAAAVLEMPPRMPRAALSQDVGLTRISVDYRSPAVRGRDLWGSRVPFGEPWLAGDSPQATIGFSRAVDIGGKTVPAGTYALVATPSPTRWTFALRETGGAREAPTEITHLEAAVEPIEPRERLRFLFSSFTASGAALDLEWERVRVTLPIAVDTDAQILSSIAALDRRDGDLGREYADAAKYLLAKTAKTTTKTTNDPDHDKGLAYLARASALGALEGPPIAPPSLSAPGERGVTVARPKAATRAPGANEIGPVIKNGRAAIQGCYERALRRDPALGRGRITVSIAIGALGLVKNVTLQTPDALRPVEPCVIAAVSQWVFPPSPEAYSAELPFVLDGHE
jgi:hypothetical protein